jgi:hypothetical protein
LPLSSLAASRDRAITRLKEVERRLARFPEFRQQYLEFMQEYEELDHMKGILVLQVNDLNSYYLFCPEARQQYDEALGSISGQRRRQQASH